MNQNKEPRLPSVGEFVRGVGTLTEVVVVPPPPQPPPRTLYAFESTNAQMRVLLHGKVLTEGPSRNDFYGKETSVETVIKEAKKYCTANKITAASDIEVIAVRIVETELRMLRRYVDAYTKANFYDETFLAFDDERPDCLPSEWRNPQPVETVVWSSKRADKEEPRGWAGGDG
jgi:hypothetical protein